MAVFSTDQNRQLYVVDKLVTAEPAAEGELQLGKTADNKQFFFKYYGKGGLLRTDLIDVDTVQYAKITPKANLRRPLKTATISLDSNVNSGAPIPGQDYIVRIIIDNYIAIGNGNTYIKFGDVHAVAGMTAAQFYTALANSLTQNFSREATQMFTFTATSTGVTVMEVEQPWRLGTMQSRPINFQIYVLPVSFQGDDVIWATVNDEGLIPITASTTMIGNGKKIADLEYFCMGERGDQYRNVGYPYVIHTAYMVDPTKEYDVLDMHYFFSDTGVNNEKSEKDITFVSDDATVLTAIKTALTPLGVVVQ